jgi:hypothetical protein
VLNNELLFQAARVETADNAGIRGYRLFNVGNRSPVSSLEQARFRELIIHDNAQEDIS